jgi:DNA-binding transcriptional MerR regulator
MTVPTERGLRAPAHFVPISDLSKRLGITARALRYYQDRGLIRSHRLARNIRAYDLETVAIVQTIVAFRDVGLPISAIAEILSLRDDMPGQARVIRAALAQARADKERVIARIDMMLEATAASLDGVQGPPPSTSHSSRYAPPLARTPWCFESVKEGVSG